MTYERIGDHIAIRLLRDFNLLTARKAARLCEDAATIEIDLSRAKLVDTEALIVLDALRRKGKRITLRHPPPLFYEAVRILGLEALFCENEQMTCFEDRARVWTEVMA